MKRIIGSLVRRTGIRRAHVAAARMCCERYWLATVGRPRQREVGRILCYHSIGQPAWGVNDVSPKTFRSHIELALKGGLRFLPASEIARSGGSPRDVAITFDDGLKSVLTNAAPILRDFGIPWTFFPVSEWSEQNHPWGDGVILTWRDIEALLAAGAELGSHSATHPDFGAIEPERLLDELAGSRDMIERRIGVRPRTFAIPLGQSMNWTRDAARAARSAGYETIYAQAEETRPSGTIARTFVTAFDGERIFKSLLRGVFDGWEEWT
jgi:peptidoglycan/xylan/chitin deacetylase (PgdA/CDA1 family)